MSKLTVTAIAVLTLLLSVQTWRLHTAQGALQDARAIREAPARVDVAASDKKQVRSESIAASSTERLLHDAPEPASDNPIAKALAAFASTGKESKASARVDTDAKTGKRSLAKVVRVMQKHGDNSKDKSQKKDASEASRQIASARQSLRQGDYASALAQLQTAEQSASLNGKEYKALAQAYNDLGMADEALRTYQDWSHAHPNDPQSYLSLARAYESLGMNTEAASQLALYQEMAGGKTDSYANAAALYRRLGMTSQEGALLSDWVGTSPGSTQAHLAMADYYRRTGNLPSAMAEYQSILQTAPGNVNAHMNLAQTYQQMGQYAEAQAVLVSALQLQPGNADIYLRLGESYRRSGDLSSAIGTYQSVVSMEPGTTQAVRAQQQIARIQRQVNQAARPAS